MLSTLHLRSLVSAWIAVPCITFAAWRCRKNLSQWEHIENCAARLADTLQWRHDGRDSVSNHQHHDCLLSHLFRRRSKNASKLRVTGLCAWNSPGTGEFPAQMASDADNVSIWWRHHEICDSVRSMQQYRKLALSDWRCHGTPLTSLYWFGLND